MADKEQATLEEVVKSPAFRESIKNQVFAHINRPIPGEGLRFKRTGREQEWMSFLICYPRIPKLWSIR